MKKLVLAVILATVSNMAFAAVLQVGQNKIPACDTIAHIAGISSDAKVAQESGTISMMIWSEVADGKCTILFAGERVYKLGEESIYGMVKVKRPGETQAFWTFSDFFK